MGAILVYFLLSAALGAVLAHNGLHNRTLGFWLVTSIATAMAVSFRCI